MAMLSSITCIFQPAREATSLHPASEHDPENAARTDLGGGQDVAVVQSLKCRGDLLRGTWCRRRAGTPGRQRTRVLLFAALGIAFFLAQAAARISPWTPLFNGVDFAVGEADATEPRRQKVNVLRIDLRDPDIEFLATPCNGDLPLETSSETTSEFLVRQRLQVAINANFFSPCCAPGYKDLRGLAISRGRLVSPPEASGRGVYALVITRNNVAAIVSTQHEIDFAAYWTAVAGSDRLVAGGKPAEFPDDPFYSTAHPRTAIGITRDGNHLLMMTIDGRQEASVGASMVETAEWLLRFGAYEGLNLDGGGSTTMVRAENGRAVVLNRPSGSPARSGQTPKRGGPGGAERSNGNNLGVYAKPLPTAAGADSPEAQ
jgi:hypothetical protein